MDIAKRLMAKIARELNKFTVRTLREKGMGVSELDMFHTMQNRRRSPRSWGWRRARRPGRQRIWRQRCT